MNTRASPDLKKYIKKELKEIIDKRPKFKQHLIQRGIYGIYLSTASKYICSYRNAIDIEQRLNHIAMSEVPIDTSMTWCCTKQGREYWNKINADFPYIRDGFLRNK